MKDIIYKTSLFSKMAPDEFEEIYKQIVLTTMEYEKSDLVGGIYEQQNGIGILLDGKIHAMKYLVSGKSMFLREFNKGDIFGLGSVFQEKDTKLSYMEVIRKTRIVYINEDELMKLFRYEQILRNYLIFANSKIKYLNHKIEVLSQTSIKDKVLMYIYDQWLVQNQEKKVRFPISKNTLADYLGVSRASLYRVMIELEEEGVLKLHKNYIVLFQDLNRIL